MRTIITHNNPHLDEIVCVWLLRRYLSTWKNARVKFLPTNPTGGPIKNPDADSRIIYVGLGRGKFDEHKGNINDSATTLVYKYLVREKKIKLTGVEQAALQELVNYTNADDHGRLLQAPHAEFSISAALTYLSGDGPGRLTSGEQTKFILTYIDGVFTALLEKFALATDWKKAKFFKTPWGKGLAIETAVNAKVVLRRATREGIVLAAVVNPKNKFRSLRSLADSKVDLTRAFQIVKKLEPKAEWYLHHSKKMLICGSDVAANLYLSKLPLRALIELVAI